MLEAAVRIVLLLLVAAISTEGLVSTVVGSTSAGVTLLTSAEGRGPVSTVLQLRPVHVESAVQLVLSILLHLMLKVRGKMLLQEVLLVHHVLRVHLLLHHLLV